MSDSNKNPVPVLTEIATEIIINELKRRRAAGELNDAQLLELSGEQWAKAEKDADALGKLDHE